MVTISGITAAPSSTTADPEIVEIHLLLTTSRFNALIALSKKNQQSVGQLLRALIDRALRDEEPADEVNGSGTFV